MPKKKAEKRRVTITVPAELVAALEEAQRRNIVRPPLTQLILAAIEQAYA